MPGLVRKILIFAAVDGIVLEEIVPQSQRGQRPPPSVKISYRDNAIEPLQVVGQEEERRGKGFDAFGVIGMCWKKYASTKLTSCLQVF